MSENDDDFDGCDHLDADVDFLMGRIVCTCGYRHWMTTEEFRRWQDLNAKAEQAFEEYIAKCEADDAALAPPPRAEGGA